MPSARTTLISLALHGIPEEGTHTSNLVVVTFDNADEAGKVLQALHSAERSDQGHGPPDLFATGS